MAKTRTAKLPEKTAPKRTQKMDFESLLAALPTGRWTQLTLEKAWSAKPFEMKLPAIIENFELLLAGGEIRFVGGLGLSGSVSAFEKIL